MKEGIQTSYRKEVLKVYGCYFFDILRLVELETGESFNADNIDVIYSDCYNEKIIGKDCFINDPVKVANKAARHALFKRIETPREKPASGRYIICNEKPGYTHFTLWDGEKVWDSLDPNRSSNKGYKPSGYRVLV